MYLETALQKMYIADLSYYFCSHFMQKTMKHPTKLALTSTTPEHIGLKNRPLGNETVPNVGYVFTQISREVKHFFRLTYAGTRERSCKILAMELKQIISNCLQTVMFILCIYGYSSIV